jgi:transcriptional regulator with GAF, ATPase, and Fis domain
MAGLAGAIQDLLPIAATNINLREAVKAGHFRDDLFFRLNVFPIKAAPAAGMPRFRERAVDALVAYDWPANVRELENIIERAVILADDGGSLDLGHLFTSGEEIDSASFILKRNGAIVLSEPPDPEPGHIGSKPGLEEAEATMLRSAVHEAKGNLARAARSLGISRPKCAYRLRKYGIQYAGA